MSRVNVFVLHYEDQAKTEECLTDMLGGNGGADTHFFVIDNGSHKPFQGGKWLTEVRVVVYQQNLPLIEAFNRAMRDNPADVYVCMANDTHMWPGTLRRMVRELDDPAVGIVAPGTNDSGVGLLWVGNKPQPNEPTLSVPDVDNTCWAFTQRLVDAIGWPDCTGHTHRACWGSNRDYCFRARQAGFEVLAVRGAFIWHAHNGGQDMVADQAGREWLSRKYQGKAARP